MQVQVVDLLGADPGRSQGFFHGRLGTKAIGLRRGDMVGVAAGAAAQQADRLAAGQRFLAHQKQRRAFADIDALAVGREGLARFGRNGLQGGKPIEGQAAQAVHAATEHRIAKPQIDQALGTKQGPRPGGAGGGDHVAGAAQSQPVAEKGGRRRQLLLGIVIAGRQLAVLLVLGNALAGFFDARGAGAENHADAPGTELGDGGADLAFDFQGSGQQQLVIAAGWMAGQGGQRGQFARHGAHRQRPLGHPAALRAHAAGIAGKQRLGHGGLALAEGAVEAQGIEINRHQGALSSGSGLIR